VTDDHALLDAPVVIATISYTSKHGGHPLAIEVTDEGRFLATVGEVEVDADTLDGAKRQIDDTVYGYRVEVPFVDAATGRRGVLRGFHAGQRKLLVTWQDGSKDTIDPYRMIFPGEAVTDEQAARIVALVEQMTEARRLHVAAQEGSVKAQTLLAEKIGEDLFDFRRHDPVGV